MSKKNETWQGGVFHRSTGLIPLGGPVERGGRVRGEKPKSGKKMPIITKGKELRLESHSSRIEERTTRKEYISLLQKRGLSRGG